MRYSLLSGDAINITNPQEKTMVLHNFIVFEGIDGSGTSTQLNILKEKLAGRPVFFTAEPTTGETGKFLRRVLSGEIPVHPETAAYLFAADRSEHVSGKDGIIERTKNGEICISDRYLFSSLAYQSQECGESLPERLNEHFPLPEILFFFAIDPALSLKRIIGRGVVEIYEKEDFLRKTEASYIKVIEKFKAMDTGMTIVEIDATRPIEQVTETIMDVLRSKGII